MRQTHQNKSISPVVEVTLDQLTPSCSRFSLGPEKKLYPSFLLPRNPVCPSFLKNEMKPHFKYKTKFRLFGQIWCLNTWVRGKYIKKNDLMLKYHSEKRNITFLVFLDSVHHGLLLFLPLLDDFYLNLRAKIIDQTSIFFSLILTVSSGCFFG